MKMLHSALFSSVLLNSLLKSDWISIILMSRQRTLPNEMAHQNRDAPIEGAPSVINLSDSTWVKKSVNCDYKPRYQLYSFNQLIRWFGKNLNKNGLNFNTFNNSRKLLKITFNVSLSSNDFSWFDKNRFWFHGILVFFKLRRATDETFVKFWEKVFYFKFIWPGC